MPRERDCLLSSDADIILHSSSALPPATLIPLIPLIFFSYPPKIVTMLSISRESICSEWMHHMRDERDTRETRGINVCIVSIA